MRNKTNNIILLGIAILLIVPTYWYVASLNIIYIYSALLLMLFFVFNIRKMPKPPKTNNYFFIVFLSYVIIVAAIQKNILYGIVTLVSTLGIVYLIMVVVKSKASLLSLIHYISIITFISCLIGIIESITTINIFHIIAKEETDFFVDYRMGHIRISSQFAQPIVFGLFLILVSPLIVYIITETNKKYRRLFYKAVYVLMCISIILTSSRAPIVAFFLLQMIFIYKVKKKRIFLVLFGALAVIYLLYVLDIFLGFGFKESANSFFEMFFALGQDSSKDNAMGIGNRLELFDWVSRTVKDNFWFGNGINAIFSYEVYSWQIKESIENEYLNTFFHYGIVGVFLQVSAYVGNVIWGFKNAKKNNNKQGKLNLVWAISVCLLVFYITIFTSGQSNSVTTHIVLVSIMMACVRINNIKGRKSENIIVDRNN